MSLPFIACVEIYRGKSKKSSKPFKTGDWNSSPKFQPTPEGAFELVGARGRPGTLPHECFQRRLTSTNSLIPGHK